MFGNDVRLVLTNFGGYRIRQRRYNIAAKLKVSQSWGTHQRRAVMLQGFSISSFKRSANFKSQRKSSDPVEIEAA